MPIKRWTIRQADDEAARRAAKALGLPPLAVRILAGRGFDTQEAIRRFLTGDCALTDPMALRDMDRAVKRIRRAIAEGEKIAVYGDYDCDGILSTVVLYSYLESAGADVCYYIPHRDREGYGLNREALQIIRDDGVRLVITVDNGITAVDEVAFAASIGIDVVVTDHHKPRDMLPQAVAVVDPHRLDDESGCEYLAGIGVAFKLICALEGDDGDLMLEQYGDLIAVATVADIVPLVGENRTIVRRGLESLQSTDNEGLAALIRVCGMADRQLSCENIAYGIVPRINSAGRFDCVDNAVELFSGGCDEPETLAGAINSLNEKRRAVEDQIVRQIMNQLDAQTEELGRRIIVIHGEGWHHGVVGIVASRMVERFGKPCIVFSVEGDVARGSARSIEGFQPLDGYREMLELGLKSGAQVHISHLRPGYRGLPAPELIDEACRSVMRLFDEYRSRGVRASWDVLPHYADAGHYSPMLASKLGAYVGQCGGLTRFQAMLGQREYRMRLKAELEAGVNPGVNDMAKKQNVEIRLYSIIDELLEDITDALAGKLEPEKREKPIGTAKILQVIELSKGPKICGCMVESGSVHVGAKARVRRSKELIYNGEVASLRRFKDDVKEVKAGLECGIRLDNFNDFIEGDEIELYDIELKKATL